MGTDFLQMAMTVRDDALGGNEFTAIISIDMPSEAWSTVNDAIGFFGNLVSPWTEEPFETVAWTFSINEEMVRCSPIITDIE